MSNLSLDSGMRFHSGASLIVSASSIADGTVIPMVNALEGCYSLINPVTTATLSTAGSMSAEYQGLLVRTQGTVTNVVLTDDIITDIYLKDESGVESHVYINGYVGYSGYGADIEEFVKIGAQISVVGIASEGFTGYRLRVRDRHGSADVPVCGMQRILSMPHH